LAPSLKLAPRRQKKAFYSIELRQKSSPENFIKINLGRLSALQQSTRKIVTLFRENKKTTFTANFLFCVFLKKRQKFWRI
jgi:hypothetical protein